MFQINLFAQFQNTMEKMEEVVSVGVPEDDLVLVENVEVAVMVESLGEVDLDWAKLVDRG